MSENGFVMEDIEAWSVILQLMGFLEAINRAFEGYDPSQIATYVMDLSKAFNKYYATVRILEDIESKQARLTLVHCVKTVLKEGLRLLRLEAPEEM